MSGAKYEPVIGLEVHVQLLTKTKAFCGCSTEFGRQPNSCACPVCLGFPGSLPVLNREAFRHSIKVALALNCKIQDIVKFDRKNYYYPDLPKNYQISQYDKPIGYDGNLELMSNALRPIKIRRVHLEEDAGKLLHDQDKIMSVVDYNRSGTPLLEIVTEPDITSPDEAYEYLSTLKTVLLYLGVSDCNMEEGSLRCDANISMRPQGSKGLGVKCEIKNMNSFKAVRSGLIYEINRQTEALLHNEKISQETRLWDADSEKTFPMRSKEETEDYRYFPEPDLVPFIVSKEEIESIKKTLPELPLRKKERFVEGFGLNMKEADLLVADKHIAEYFENTVKLNANPKSVFNWISGDIMSRLNEQNISITGFNFSPAMLAELISLVDKGTINGKMAKDIFKESAENNISPAELVEKRGLRQITDVSEIETVIDKVIAENAKSVNDFKSGKTNALAFLVGQTMKLTKGKANPGIVNKLLQEKLKK